MAKRVFPLIVIIGTTACGKSKLAIELASKFGGEIINADSMQVYKGLDIATNKVTNEELKQAKHHLIGFVNPNEKFSVVDFRDKGIALIDDLFQKNILPIVVGGTHYYIESVLWNNFILGDKKMSNVLEDGNAENSTKTCLMDTEIDIYRNLDQNLLHTNKDLDDIDKFFEKPILHSSFQELESSKLWKILEQVDPEAAAAIHPNNKRRLIRSLQVIQSRRKNYSDILRSMNKVGEKECLGGPLRYNPTCVFWLHCDEKKLIDIVEDRVDQMLDRGLLAELEEFHEEFEKIRLTLPANNVYGKGILQTIGFKEFFDYLNLTEDDKGTDRGDKILKNAIAEMKRSTVKYSKRQIRWIINRLVLSRHKRELPIVFKLETSTNDADWDSNVMQPAFKIVDSYLNGQSLTEDMLHYAVGDVKKPDIGFYKPGIHYCDVCDKTFIGSHSIEGHLNSRTHKRKIGKRVKTE